jgi:YbgC/YbaW family acyl-CoA thioester hydrolase
VFFVFFVVVSAVVNPKLPRIQTEVQIMFFDTDSGGVVSNIAYLRFIETARTLLAEELGLRLVEMATKQQYPVVVRTEIDYRRAAKFGDRLLIEGSLERTERVRFWCGFRVVRLSDNELIATCRQMLALIEMPAARPLPLPREWEKYRTVAATSGLGKGA